MVKKVPAKCCFLYKKVKIRLHYLLGTFVVAFEYSCHLLLLQSLWNLILLDASTTDTLPTGSWMDAVLTDFEAGIFGISLR